MAKPSGTWTTAGCSGRVFTAFSSDVDPLVLEPSPDIHPTNDASAAREAVHASDDGSPSERFRSAALFLGIVLLMAVDLFEDWREGSQTVHLGLESVVLVLAALGVWLLRARIVREQAALRALRSRLTEARAAAESWRRETESLSAGLGRAIDSQFQVWKLTDAEREVAVLLVKGFALREIATLRETSERTVRQQALGVYRKAGLTGRAELAAFFLEDMLAPSPDRASRTGPLR
jgi:DNA-binding CsgD family transcriptional regulator